MTSSLMCFSIHKVEHFFNLCRIIHYQVITLVIPLACVRGSIESSEQCTKCSLFSLSLFFAYSLRVLMSMQEITVGGFPFMRPATMVT